MTDDNTRYATLAELKAQVNKTKSDDDDVLQLLLNAAADAIDGYCNREDGFLADESASARLYPGTGRAFLRIDECVEVTKVEVKDAPSDDTYDLWTSDDYLVASGASDIPDYNRKPYNLLIVSAEGQEEYFTSGRYLGRRGFTPIEGRIDAVVPTVRVTARWGYADTPPDRVRQATLTQAARWYKRGESAWADTLGSGTTGQLQYKQALDPAIKLMLNLGRLIKPAIGAI